MQPVRISKLQLTWLYANGLLGSSLLFLPQVLVVQAQQDVWIVTLLGSVGGLLLVLLWTALANRFPRQSVVEYTRQTLGPILGTIVLLPFIGYLLWLTTVMLRQIVDFFDVNYPETPIEFTQACIMLVCVYMVLNGLEVIARTNELMLPVVLTGTVLLALLAMPHYRVTNFQPVLAHGLGPVLRALPAHMDFPYGNAVAFLMIFPYLRQPRDLRAAAVTGTLLGSAIMITFVTVSLLVLGPASMARVIYPPHFAARTVIVGRFLAGLDGLVDMIWLVSSVIRITIFLYASTLGISQLLGMSSNRYLAIPLGLLTSVSAILVYNTLAEQIRFIGKFVAFGSMPIYLGFPLLVLGLAYIRKLGASKGAEK